jgi:hypothetical protein
VCSGSGGAIDEIAKAIDDLAAQAQEEKPAQELHTRLAAIWSMVGKLNPDLARRQREYTRLPD